jgi:hypothetical protein
MTNAAQLFCGFGMDVENMESGDTLCGMQRVVCGAPPSHLFLWHLQRWFIHHVGSAVARGFRLAEVPELDAAGR